MSGHIHSHSRTCTVADKDCVKADGDGEEEGGVLHVITGSGGHKLSKIKHHQPHWVEYARRSWGYSRFTVRRPPRTRGSAARGRCAGTAAAERLAGIHNPCIGRCLLC